MDLTKSNNLMHETAVSVELKMIVIKVANTYT